MANAFKPGDQVQLKSGGPIMTVSKYDSYDGEPMVVCQWFDTKQPAPLEYSFSEAQLVRVPDDGGHRSAKVEFDVM